MTEHYHGGSGQTRRYSQRELRKMKEKMKANMQKIPIIKEKEETFKRKETKDADQLLEQIED